MRRRFMLIMSISGVKKQVDHPVPQAEIRSPSEQSAALSFSDQRNAFAAPGKSQNDNCNKLFQLRKKEKMEHCTANNCTKYTKNLMQGSFTREHHCGQCGTTLYYSPEQNR